MVIMSRFFLFAIFFFISLQVYPIDINPSVSTHAYAMGNTITVVPGLANPAYFGFSRYAYASIQYVNRYGVKELSTFSAQLNLPNNYLDTAVLLSRFGCSEYNETVLGANFYKQVSAHLSIGIQTNLYYLQQTAQTAKLVVVGNVGLLARPFDSLDLSLLLVNPLRSVVHYGATKVRLPALLLVGMAYHWQDKAQITFELEKDVLFPLVVKTGLEYQPISTFSIRLGMFGKPFTPTFGFGVWCKNFLLDFGCSKHPVLGFRSSCGLTYRF